MPTTTSADTSTPDQGCDCPYPDNTCQGRNARTYFEGTDSEIRLCRQCATRFGIDLSVNACVDGADVENVVRAICLQLAQQKLKDKK